MKTSDFVYDLPEELIAQTPATPRDSSRLMAIDRRTGSIAHRTFRDLPEYLRRGDTLVVNDTKVIPARLIGERPSGGAVELLLLRRLSIDTWETLAKPGAKLKPGTAALFGGGKLEAKILDTTESGGRIVRFEYSGAFEAVLDELGTMPLPPYIHEKLDDPARYQTVYAAHDGSAAAPTAGLHFTPELLDAIQNMGVNIARLMLHVGLGTFRPVRVESPESHKMHSEYYELRDEAATLINNTREKGGRVICVGTTSLRALESCVNEDGTVRASSGFTEIFIYPGKKIRSADALITNFHLPASTLLMLVSAFWNTRDVLDAYNLAVRERYRFFSFGDAMIIY